MACSAIRRCILSHSFLESRRRICRLNGWEESQRHSSRAALRVGSFLRLKVGILMKRGRFPGIVYAGRRLFIVVSVNTCGWVRGTAKNIFCALSPRLFRDGENGLASHFNGQWEDRLVDRGDIDPVPAVLRTEYSTQYKSDISATHQSPR